MKVKIDISKLLYNQVKEIEINESVEINSSYYQNTSIVSLKPVTLFGSISKNYEDKIVLQLSLKGIMILKDSRTLDDVSYEYSSEINTLIDENMEIKQNMLDIEPILWENIILEVPIRIVSNENPMNIKGEGWEVKDN